MREKVVTISNLLKKNNYVRNKLLSQRDLPDIAFEQVVIHTFGINFVTQRLVYGTKSPESTSEKN